MKASILIRAWIILVVFSIVAALMTPPDLISQIVVIFEMVIVCGFLTLIISRFKSLKQTPESIKKLIIVLVCLLSISITSSVTFFMRCHQMRIDYHNLRTQQSE
jgi:Sec-independent protein secretion pathway component TatC